MSSQPFVMVNSAVNASSIKLQTSSDVPDITTTGTDGEPGIMRIKAADIEMLGTSLKDRLRRENLLEQKMEALIDLVRDVVITHLDAGEESPVPNDKVKDLLERLESIQDLDRLSAVAEALRDE